MFAHDRNGNEMAARNIAPQFLQVDKRHKIWRRKNVLDITCDLQTMTCVDTMACRLVGVCRGTPVVVTGRPHPGLSTKLLSGSGDADNDGFGELLRGARLGRQFILTVYAWRSANNRFAAHAVAELRGYFRSHRIRLCIFATFLGGATDGPTVGDSGRAPGCPSQEFYCKRLALSI